MFEWWNSLDVYNKTVMTVTIMWVVMWVIGQIVQKIEKVVDKRHKNH